MAKTLSAGKTFLWEGTDRNGARVKGSSTAPNEAMIRLLLRKQGIRPRWVRKQRNRLSIRIGGARKKKITPRELAVLARQLSTMMAAGVPLMQALRVIARAAGNPSIAKLVATIQDDINQGAALAEALSSHPKYFDNLFVSLVAVGEASGTLDAVLDRIATYKEKIEAIKAKVRKAMYYPGAVIAAAFVVMGTLLYYVVPQFQLMFRNFGADLPTFTLLVIHLSELVQRTWWVVLGVVGLGAFAFLGAHRRSRAFRHLVDRLLLHIPVVGAILHQAATARFTRTLATMLAAGVPLMAALESVAKASGNIVFERAVLRIRDHVGDGNPLHLAMSSTALFESMAIEMVAIGEEAGALDTMCAKVAGFYEQEVDAQVDALSSLLEPLIMTVIGVLVGGMVIAMYLPIFKLGSVV